VKQQPQAAATACVNAEPAVALAVGAARSTQALSTPDAAHFAAPQCHNCGAALATPFCGACGQKRARRLDFGAVRSEAWQSYRLFELSLVKGALNFLRAPGLVAREFVLGARARHIHPLKLLLIAIGLLLLALSRTNALASQNANLGAAIELVRAYANWSFSLGIVAIVGASTLVLRWRQPFNLTEHLVLGVYVHFLVILANLVNQLPLLVLRAPAILAAHKTWSNTPMDIVEALLVVCVFRQFFALSWQRDAWRLLLAAIAFIAIKTLLMRLFSLVVVKLVLYQLA
jgi:hypothetical protein